MRKVLLLAAAVGCSFGLPVQASTFAYISSPADGLISQYRLDEQSGALRLVEQTKAGDQVNPIGVFQGSCRVNRLTMLLFSQRFALD
ncbi:hypothetical protein A264_24260, partial [Pseudomonas syringae pv. actinidiae ICMP 19071]